MNADETSGFQSDDTAAAALTEALEAAERSCGCQPAAQQPLPGAAADQDNSGEPGGVSPDSGRSRPVSGDSGDAETAARLGEPYPVRFPRETVAVIQQVAAQEGVTVSAWIRQRVRDEIDRRSGIVKVSLHDLRTVMLTDESAPASEECEQARHRLRAAAEAGE